MKFSVAICTWNRARLLEQTFNSFCNINSNGFNWEILVVDNNSTDDTPAVCQSFSERLPIRRVVETKQGHSIARNRAIDEARGEFLAWTDDDVIVDENWLAAYQNAIDVHSESTFFGGKIIPKFEQTPPAWVTQNWSICCGLFAARDLGDQPFQFDSKRLPFGANFITRRSVQQDFLFRKEFGRQGQQVRGFDEIDVLNRMLQANHHGWWVPESTLDHVIPESRVSLSYVRDYFSRTGPDSCHQRIRKTGYNSTSTADSMVEVEILFKPFSSSEYWFPLFVQFNNLQGQLDTLEE